MTRRDLVLPVCAFSAAYLAFVAPLLFVPAADFSSIAATTLYAVLALSISADFAEALCAWWWRASPIPRTPGVPRRDRTAILMTVCDDWSASHFNDLELLVSGGYAVFVLDDSSEPAEIPTAPGRRIIHMRRPHRTHAKAGNLNHWLRERGRLFDYAIVLDADSRMSVACADCLVATAEHPANSDVAMCQSKLVPSVASSSLFVGAQAAVAIVRAHILDRVHQRLGLVLSAGHNVLIRLEPIRALGGFDETLSNEDTTLSLHLSEWGYRTVLVDTWSEDTNPETVATHNRRTVRWARQTFELFNRPWHSVPLRLKLLLCRHTLEHSFPLVGTAVLMLSVWKGPVHVADSIAITQAAFSLNEGLALYGLSLWFVIIVSAGLVLLRAILGLANGVSLRRQFLAAFALCAPSLTLIVPLACGIVASLCGRQTSFTPTNHRQALRRDSAAASRVSRILPAALVAAMLTLAVIRRPGSLLVGFNGLWVACLLLSPLVLAMGEWTIRYCGALFGNRHQTALTRSLLGLIRT
jgi:cellulose synthase/poly-beta-1,6-N-acetylglucosamine synthase-like glycosyltransferase